MNTLDARRRLLGRNVYKKTVEGNPAIAQGSLSRRNPGITMQGWTEQAQYEGKNLIDYTKAESRISSQTVEIIDGGIKWTGDYYFVIPLTGIKKNQTYVASYVSDNAGDWALAYTDGTLTSGVKGNSITTDSERDCNRIFIYKSDPIVVAEDMVFTDIMLNEGSTALPYEPYTGRQPSPNPDYPQDVKNAGNYNEETQKYQYQVKLTGANLVTLDKDSLLNVVNGSVVDIPKGVQFSYTLVRDCYGRLNLQLKRNTKYFLKMDVEIVDSNNLDTVINNYHPIAISKESSNHYSGNVLNVLWKNHSSTNVLHGEFEFTTPEDEDCVIYLYGNSFYSNITGITNFTNFIVSEVDVPYEAQKTPQTVTLTSDRPLTKWDKLEKRNGQWGWVYKSDEIVLDGSEDETWLVYNIGFKVANILPEVMLQRECYCTQFTRGTGYDENSVWVGSNAGNNDIYFPNVPSYYDAELKDKGLGNFKQHVSENPITILTYLDEETFVPLSESEQEQMNALYTFRPTTVLSNDCECNMTLTYKTKKSLQPVSGGYKEA